MDRCRSTSVIATGARILPLVAALLAASVVALGLWAPAGAQDNALDLPPDTACKLCHVDTEGQHVLPSGEVLTATVDLAALAASVHGADAAQPVYCTDCHQDRRRYLYPHRPNPAQTLDEFQADIASNCEQCHAPASMHNPGHLLAEGNANLPNCVDCHGGHSSAPVAVMAADPIATCQGCHATFEDDHVAAVHAEVVANLPLGESCETCHGDMRQSADARCQACHSLLTSQLTLRSADQVNLNVHPEDILNSVHGERIIDGQIYPALQCTDCHKDQARYGFPHPEIDAATTRSLTVAMEGVCTECHADIAERSHNGVHAKAIAEGRLNAASCADCHGNHAIQDPDEPRERVSTTCGKCHSAINETYAMSVHGAALLGEHNPDVPVCTDCHGVHDIADPTTAAFRLSSPQMCGECHADSEKMARYDVSTDVFDTYVADFHGTTVELFDKQHPDQETNKAVCYDCHGIHDILPANDENSHVIKQNLLVTCQQCHPDATDNFPDAWTSHFRPSLDHNPLVYLVNLFYAIVIPVTVGGFVLFIGTDIFRRVWDRMRGRKYGAK